MNTAMNFKHTSLLFLNVIVSKQNFSCHIAFYFDIMQWENNSGRASEIHDYFHYKMCAKHKCSLLGLLNDHERHRILLGLRISNCASSNDLACDCLMVSANHVIYCIMN